MINFLFFLFCVVPVCLFIVCGLVFSYFLMLEKKERKLRDKMKLAAINRLNNG